METWLPRLAEAVAADIRQGRVTDKAGLQRAKQRAARALGATRLPQDPELIAHLAPEEAARWSHLLRKKPMRSQSGVAVVAVMSSPAACPHGKCVYCPGGPEVDAPQSYTGFEPSTMRAKRYGYDPYRIVRARLGQLQRNGHVVDKVEVVVQGGTFPARDDAYQGWFIHGIYQACNDGPDLAGDGPGDETGDLADVGPGVGADDAPGDAPGDDGGDGAGRGAGDEAVEDETEWQAMGQEERRRRLRAVQEANEAAVCRVIGLTVETKPDWCLVPHVDAMLEQGATRIELGIQTLDEEVTRLTHRGHTVQDARDAMRIARDAGYKVCVHMMPGLPRPVGTKEAGPSGVLVGGPRAPALPRPAGERVRAGPTGRPLPGLPLATQPAGTPAIAAEGTARRAMASAADDASPRTPAHASAHFAVDPAADVEDLRRLFLDPDFRPDMLKIYPTLIVQEGETTLKRWWKAGRFTPLDTEGAVDVVAEGLRHVPEYCRIQRIDRDIPTTHVLAGVMHSNLRQLAEAEAKRRGIPLRDIRAREIGTRQREGVRVEPDRLELVRRDYTASGGEEAFLSLEDPEADALAGFIRIRRIGDSHRPELQDPRGAAVVRELKVYGAAQGLGAHDPDAWQHQGHGARLLAAAEAAAGAWGVGRVAVLAGAGVKEYYRRHGYTDLGPYVAKVRP